MLLDGAIPPAGKEQQATCLPLLKYTKKKLLNSEGGIMVGSPHPTPGL